MQSSTLLDLPAEMIEEVLSKLPAKDLLSTRVASTSLNMRSQNVLFKQIDHAAVAVQHKLQRRWAWNLDGIHITDGLIKHSLNHPAHFLASRLEGLLLIIERANGKVAINTEFFDKLILTYQKFGDPLRNRAINILCIFAPRLIEEQFSALLEVIISAFNHRHFQVRSEAIAFIHHVSSRLDEIQIARLYVVVKALLKETQFFCNLTPSLIRAIRPYLKDEKIIELRNEIRKRLTSCEDDDWNCSMSIQTDELLAPNLKETFVDIEFTSVMNKLNDPLPAMYSWEIHKQLPKLKILAPYLKKHQAIAVFPNLLEIVGLEWVQERLDAAEILKLLVSMLEKQHIAGIFSEAKKKLSHKNIDLVNEGAQLIETIVSRLEDDQIADMLECVLIKMNANDCTERVIALSLLSYIKHYLTEDKITEILPIIMARLNDPASIVTDKVVKVLRLFAARLSAHQISEGQLIALKQIASDKHTTMINGVITILNFAPYFNKQQITSVLCALKDKMAKAENFCLSQPEMRVLIEFVADMNDQFVQELLPMLSTVLNKYPNYEVVFNLLTRLIVLGKCSSTQLYAMEIDESLSRELLYYIAECNTVVESLLAMKKSGSVVSSQQGFFQGGVRDGTNNTTPQDKRGNRL